jgi:protein CpxP
MVQKLGLNSDQQKKIEDIFQQYRLKLVDLDGAVRKEEITLEPLMGADSPDETTTLAQIDKVAQARAELEKGNARFLFGIRRVLTPDQWKKLQEDRGGPPPQGRGR